MSRVKILWVQDEDDGPGNGMAEYNGEEVWFSRVKSPSIVSSTDVPVPPTSTESNDRVYTLYHLSPEIKAIVQRNHIAYCEETGAPLNHGDPIKFKVRSNKVRVEPEMTKATTSEESRVKLQPIAQINTYVHHIVPGDVTGEVVTTIHESNFENYLVPRRLITTNE